jgi:hypothetical protein
VYVTDQLLQLFCVQKIATEQDYPTHCRMQQLFPTVRIKLRTRYADKNGAQGFFCGNIHVNSGRFW